VLQPCVHRPLPVFALLKTQLGAIMGDPVECEHQTANGERLQATTTGLAQMSAHALAAP
jgi:hypothetical protein